MCGDFNSRTGDKIDFISDLDSLNLDLPSDILATYDPPIRRNNMDKAIKGDYQELLDLCISSDLLILNGRTIGDPFGSKTFYGSRGTSRPDYILAHDSIRKSIIYLKVLPFTRFSDHCPISLRLNFTNKLSYASPVNFERFPNRFMWDVNSNLQFQCELKSENALDTFSSIIAKCEASVNASNQSTINSDICNEFTNTLMEAANASLKKTNTRKKFPNHKWFNVECNRSKRRLNHALRRVNQQPLNDLVRHEYYDEKRKYRACLRNYKNSFLKKLNQNVEDGKIINWKNFKYLKQEYTENSPLDSYDLLAFFDYFANLYSCDNNRPRTDNSSTLTTPDESASFISELNAPITPIEVENILKSLPSGKSVAEDLISNEMLKSLDSVGLRALNCIFNHCLSHGIYPWNTSVITPIHKTGDINNPDNYRAIAVNSCLGKTFSSILLNRLIIFRNTYCNDPPSQLGFCKGAQTNDHILTLKTIIDKYRKPGKANLFACFVDFKKAFDSIRRDLLLFKITNLGITGAFFEVIN